MNAATEFAKLWNPGISGIELFHAHLFRHSFAKHMHEEYTIGINDGGQGSYSYRGETCRTYPGSFNLIHPGEIHTGQANTEHGWRFRHIYLSVPQLESVLAQLEWHRDSLPYFHEPVMWDQSLQTLFDRLFQSLTCPNAILEQQTYLLEFLAQLVDRHAQPRRVGHNLQASQLALLKSAEPNAVAIARSYLDAYFAKPISIDALAQLVGLSPYYLIRSFRQQVGLPPHGYQRHCQLVRAKQLLQTARPLSEIAIESGFYDQSHLNRYFKRVFGVTPGHYQRSHIQ